jgi:hypothetical protein
MYYAKVLRALCQSPRDNSSGSSISLWLKCTESLFGRTLPTGDAVTQADVHRNPFLFGDTKPDQIGYLRSPLVSNTFTIVRYSALSVCGRSNCAAVKHIVAGNFRWRIPSLSHIFTCRIHLSFSFHHQGLLYFPRLRPSLIANVRLGQTHNPRNFIKATPPSQTLPIDNRLSLKSEYHVMA